MLQPFYKKPFFIIPIAILLLILVAYGTAEFNYQQRINVLKREVEKAQHVVVEPAGGIENRSIYVEAPFWFTSFCIDNGPCPTVSKFWLLLIDKGKQSNFMTEALKKENVSQEAVTVKNYSEEFSRSFNKDDTNIELSITPVTNEKPPHPAPAGKEWVVFGVIAYNRVKY